MAAANLVTGCLSIAVDIATLVCVTIDASVRDNNHRWWGYATAAPVTRDRCAVIWRNLEVLVSIGAHVAAGSIGLDVEITHLLALSR